MCWVGGRVGGGGGCDRWGKSGCALGGWDGQGRVGWAVHLVVGTGGGI